MRFKEYGVQYARRAARCCGTVRPNFPEVIRVGSEMIASIISYGNTDKSSVLNKAILAFISS